MGKKNSNRHKPVDAKRRQLLCNLGLSSLLAAGGLSLPWPMQMAYGNSRPNDYKAVICLFLNGGNDGNDTLIPVDGAFTDYVRWHGDLALPRDSLHRLSLRDSNNTLALHPALKNLAQITNRGEIAWIANAGPLVEPVTAEDVRNGRARLPSFLGSHPDQQRYVSGGVPGTFASRSGWGGRTLEHLPTKLVDGLLSNLALNEDNYLMRGEFWQPVQATDSEWFAGITLRHVLDGQSSDYYKAYLAASARRQPGLDDLGRAYQRTIGNILDEALEFRRVLDRVPKSLAPTPPDGGGSDNGLVRQLRQGVRAFWAGREAGVRRQMIFLDWGGFDTHANQRGMGMKHQDGLLAALDNGLADLDMQLKAGGLHDQVVTMVISEFGRPLRPNSGGGTDHGWGNHFWVMGGPVKGSRLIGQMPTLVPGGPDDMLDNSGIWVPTINSDQIAASVMEWFGLPRSEFGKVFANLENFPSPTLDLF